MEISASHSLKLSYRSKCENLHGHNWIITVYCRSEVLNEDGMVVDFTHIKETVMGRLDHQNLNEVVSLNPTAENIARWVCEQIPTCFKVEVRESEGNTVIYEHFICEIFDRRSFRDADLCIGYPDFCVLMISLPVEAVSHQAEVYRYILLFVPGSALYSQSICLRLSSVGGDYLDRYISLPSSRNIKSFRRRPVI